MKLYTFELVDSLSTDTIISVGDLSKGYTDVSPCLVHLTKKSV